MGKNQTHRQFKGMAIGSLVIGACLLGFPNQEDIPMIKKKDNYKVNVNSNYNRLFDDATTFEDSLKIYRENEFPIKLREPSFEEKERVYRKGLENKTK